MLGVYIYAIITFMFLWIVIKVLLEKNKRHYCIDCMYYSKNESSPCRHMDVLITGSKYTDDLDFYWISHNTSRNKQGHCKNYNKRVK